MNKFLNVLCTIALVLSFLGCAAQKDVLQNNDLFTDVFFSDVVEICDTRHGQIYKEQLAPVIQYLKGLTLNKVDWHLTTVDEDGNQLYGLDGIAFVKSDGTEIAFLRNHATFSNVEIGTYTVAGEGFENGLKEAFEQAKIITPHSLDIDLTNKNDVSKAENE